MAGRKIEVQIVGDASSLSKAFGKASGSASGFGSKMASVGKLAAVGLGALGVGAAVAGKKMIEMASDAAEVQSKMEVVFGKALPGLTKQIDTFSAATGTSRFAMREQAADMGALLAPMLGSKQAASDMSLQFTKLATDIGSFNNVPTADALLAIRSGLVGEAEPLRRFGVLLNATAVEQEGLRLGLVKGKKAMTEQQKVQARASLIMKQTSLAQGDATRTAGSMANQMKMLKSNISDTATSLGMALLPAANNVVAGMNSFIGKFKEADSAGDKFRVVVGALGDIARTAGTGIKDAFNAIDWQAVGKTLMDGLHRAFDFLSGVDWGGILKNVGSNVLGELKSVFNAINWGELGSALGRMLVLAFNKIATFMNSVNWNAVGQALVRGIGIGLKALGSFLAGVNWGTVLKAIGLGIIAVLKGLGGLLLGIAGAVGKAIITGIKNGAVALWGGLKSWLAGIPGQIKGLFSGAAKWLYNAGLAVLSGFWDGLKSKWNAVAGWVGGLGGKIKGLKGPIGKDRTLLLDEGRAIMDGLRAGLEAGWLKNVAFLRGIAAATVKEINALQGQLNAINARRETQDRAAAVRDATAALAEARKKKEGVAAAELALARAREDIVVAGLNRQLVKEQAALERRKTMIQSKMTAITSAVQKASDKLLAAFDRATGGHTTAAGGALNAISARRQQEDLASAVEDAQARLAEAMEGGDGVAITAAQRALFRAQEDIQIASLESQKVTQEQAWTAERESLREHLEKRLVLLSAAFAKEGATVAGALAAINKLALVGGPATGGGSVAGGGAKQPIILKTYLDGKLLTESVQEHATAYQRSNGAWLAT